MQIFMINDDKLVYLDLDIDVPCDPIIYPCTNGIQVNRNKRDCYDKASCEATCVCKSDDEQSIGIPSVTTKQPTIFVHH